MATGRNKEKAYGLRGFVEVFPEPIVTNRAPGSSDSGELGQVWIDNTNNAAYTLVNKQSKTWANTGGGAGSFSSLDVTSSSFSVTPDENSVAGTTITLNSRFGIATFTGQTTASGGTATLTINNSEVTSGEPIMVTVSNIGTNDAQMTVQRVDTQGGGAISIDLKNNGAAALNGDIIVTFWLVKSA